MFRILALTIALAFPAASTVGMLCDALCPTEAAADCHGHTPLVPHCQGAPVGAAPTLSATDSDCASFVSSPLVPSGSGVRLASSFHEARPVLSAPPQLLHASRFARRGWTPQIALPLDNRSQLSTVLRI